MVVFAIALALASFGGLARAQDDEDVGHEDDLAPVARAGAARMELQFVANNDQVEQWLFGRYGGIGGARSKLESALAVRLDDLERAFGLTAAQKKKLKLAGNGDLKRFFDRVAALKRGSAELQRNPNANLAHELQPLQAELAAGLFGDGSIFGKTIGKTLDADQAARYQSMVRERISGRRRATIEWFAVHIGSNVGLSSDQRSRLVELIVNHTPAPKKFGQGDYWVTMYNLSRLPEDKLQPIFDAPQWRLMRRQLAQARVMEQWLRSNGMLPDDGPGAPQAEWAVERIAPARVLVPPPKKAIAPQARAREVPKQ
jgi:hypothetical protein